MTRISELTVLLPAYNAELTLDATLQSLQAQTWREFEVLLLDDGSTDRTPDIARQWAARDSRFMHVRAPRNQGLIATLNEGLARASTRWVARMDADDLCDPRRFEWQTASLEADPNTTVLGAQGRLFGAQHRAFRVPVSAQGVAARIAFDTPLLHPSVVMDSDWLRAHGIQYRADYPLAEDYDLWSQVFRAGGRIRNIPQQALAYRIHNESVSRQSYRGQKVTAARITAELLAFAGCPMRPEELALVQDYPFEGSMLPARATLATMRALNRRIATAMTSLLGDPGSTTSRFERARFFAKMHPRPSSRKDQALLAASLVRIDAAMAGVFVSHQLRGRAF